MVYSAKAHSTPLRCCFYWTFDGVGAYVGLWLVRFDKPSRLANSNIEIDRRL